MVASSATKLPATAMVASADTVADDATVADASMIADATTGAGARGAGTAKAPTASKVASADTVAEEATVADASMIADATTGAGARGAGTAKAPTGATDPGAAMSAGAMGLGKGQVEATVADSVPSLEQVWSWLDTVPDPEIPVISLVDLGIIRDVAWQGDTLVVTVTPTYSGCPATSIINLDIETALRGHGIETLQIKRQLSPAWTTDWLSDAGRAKLEDYGIAPPQPAGGPERCPNCQATALSRVSQFGSTPCKALWRCDSCLEPFDYFKCI